MKWLFLNNHPWLIGGLQSLSIELATGLMDLGHSVEIVCFDKNPYQELQCRRSDQCSFQRPPAMDTRCVTVQSAMAAWKSIRKSKADAIFVCNTGLPDFLPYLVAASFAGVRHVVAHQGTMVSELPSVQSRRYLGGLLRGFGLWKKRFQLSSRIAYRSVTVAMFHSDSQREGWVKSYGFPNARRELWFAPVDLTRFRQCISTRRRIRCELGFDEQFVIGGAGMLCDQKSFDVLVEAGACLKSNGREFRIVLVGDGPNAADIRSQIHRLGMEDSVQMLGRRQDMPALMNAMDAFVLPSTDANETLGIVIAEAMACGVPCVVTDLPGPSRIAGDGYYATVVPQRNPAAIAEALVQLMDDPVLYHRLRNNGFRRAAECDRSVVVSTLLSYMSLDAVECHKGSTDL